MCMKTILYVGQRGIGDKIWAIPLLRSLHRAYPDAIIEYVTNGKPSSLEMLKLIGRFVQPTDVLYPSGDWQDQDLFEERRARHADQKELKHYFENRVVNKILRREYDLALITKGMVTSPAGERKPYHLNLGCKQVTYLDIKEELATHIVDRYLQLADVLHIHRVNSLDLEVDYKLPVTLSDGTAVASDNYCVLNLQSGVPKKKWNQQGFAAVSLWLQAQGVETILVGGNEEFEMAKRVPATLNTVIQGYSLNLENYARLARKARVVVSADTGLMHLADAAGCRVIGLFGPTKPESCGPYSNRAYVVKERTMEDIRPEYVIERLKSILR